MLAAAQTAAGLRPDAAQNAAKASSSWLGRRAAAAPHPQHPDAGDEVERPALGREGQGEVGGFGCVSLFHPAGASPATGHGDQYRTVCPASRAPLTRLMRSGSRTAQFWALAQRSTAKRPLTSVAVVMTGTAPHAFCQRPGQRVGTAQMARQERHGEVPALVHDHHRRVGGLAPAVGRDGPHRDAHSSHKNQGLVLCKMLRRPVFQGPVSAAAAHAAGQSFRQPMGQRFAFCGEGQICPAHCPASVPCRNSVVKAGS